MTAIFETLNENFIIFEKNKIGIIIDDNDKIWFNGNELTKAIGYSDSRDAMRSHTDKLDRIQIKNIIHSLDIKQHPQTVYISEAGLYKLILRSKLKSSKKFSDWVTNDVLPSIRKYGYYKMKKSYENEKNDLLKKINYLEKQNKLMINDMKKEKYPDGALVYILDYSDDDPNEPGIYRLGKTDDLNKRKKIYNTHMLHNKPVLCKEFVEKPIPLESCIRSMLYEYRYKNKKDFFVCSEKYIKRAFSNCLRSLKNMKQQGGGNKIDILKKKINKLTQQILQIDKMLIN